MHRASCVGDGLSTMGAETELVLPAGDYIAFARNQTRKGEREFTLQAGEIKSVPIIAGN